MWSFNQPSVGYLIYLFLKCLGVIEYVLFRLWVKDCDVQHFEIGRYLIRSLEEQGVALRDILLLPGSTLGVSGLLGIVLTVWERSSAEGHAGMVSESVSPDVRRWRCIVFPFGRVSSRFLREMGLHPSFWGLLPLDEHVRVVVHT